VTVRTMQSGVVSGGCRLDGKPKISVEADVKMLQPFSKK
jgi:hypothetical protein